MGAASRFLPRVLDIPQSQFRVPSDLMSKDSRVREASLDCGISRGPLIMAGVLVPTTCLESL